MSTIYTFLFIGGLIAFLLTLVYAIVTSGWAVIGLFAVASLALYVGRRCFVKGEDYFPKHHHLS